MIPVDQENFGPGPGNCFCACVASLLHVGLYEVPGFDGPTWWDQWQAWLGEHHRLQLRGSWEQGWGGGPLHLGYLLPAGYFLVAGPSPRGRTFPDGTRIYHSVIYYGRRMVHDPHPSRAGVERIDEVEWLEATA